MAKPIIVGLPAALDNFLPYRQIQCGNVSQKISTISSLPLFQSSADGHWIPQIASSWERKDNIVTVTIKNYDPSLGVEKYSIKTILNSLSRWNNETQTHRIKSISEKNSTQFFITYNQSFAAALPIELCAVGVAKVIQKSNFVTQLQEKFEDALTLLQSDKLDFWIKNVRPNYLLKNTLLDKKNIQKIEFLSPTTTVLYFPKNSIFFTREKRLKILTSIDKDTLIKTVIDTQVTPTNDIFPKGHPLYIPSSTISYQPKNLNNINETIEIVTDATAKTIATAKGIAVYLKRLGYLTKVKTVLHSGQVRSYIAGCKHCIAVIQIPYFSIDTLSLLDLEKSNLLETFTTDIEDLWVTGLWRDSDTWIYSKQSPNNLRQFKSFFGSM